MSDKLLQNGGCPLPPEIRVLDEQNEQIRSRRSSSCSTTVSVEKECTATASTGNKIQAESEESSVEGHKKVKKCSMSAPPPSLPKLSGVSSHNSSHSPTTKANFFSELIVQIPARQLKRIAKTQGIGSLQRETQHFVGVTSVNGLLRIYRSRGFFRLCWITVICASLFLLLWQITTLIQLYLKKPTVSQVSFLLPENGLPFPAVTLCSHNPIRRQYIENMNTTTNISQLLLEYIMLSFMDAQYLVSVRNPEKLELADQEWKALTHFGESKFNVNGFFWNASATCEQMFKVCYFGGREFNCCNYTKGILTDIGKCYQLDLSDTDQPWLRRQVQAGLTNGMQLIVDAHTEQQINSLAIGIEHPVADKFETGFRYYVHEQHSLPYLSTEGISVSPGAKVYSAVSPTNYILLPQEMWGNCSDHWPDDLKDIVKDGAAQEKYSSVKCKTLCHAKYFNELCGCSPFIYNIEEYFQMCTPYETYKCLKSTVLNATALDNESDLTQLNNFQQVAPACPYCKIECQRWVYHTYNSYAQGFSHNSMSWLRRKNKGWSPGHVRSNFVSINIFFRDMVYTEYRQMQSITMTEILSDIGGNMGLFLGMSMISLIEFFTYICKITWLFISKKRRQHMLAKKRRDEERERHLQATLEMAQRSFLLNTLGFVGGGHPLGHPADSDGTLGKLMHKIPRNVRRRKIAEIGAMDVRFEGGIQKPSLEFGTPQPRILTLDDESRKRPRSKSVIGALFSGRKASPSEKVSATSANSGRRHNLVESIIESRLHGNAARATRRSSTSSSSSSCSSSSTSVKEEVDGQQQQMPASSSAIRKDAKNKLVELKIDLEANTVKLVGPGARRSRHYSTMAASGSNSTTTMDPLTSRNIVNRCFSSNEAYFASSNAPKNVASALLQRRRGSSLEEDLTKRCLHRRPQHLTVVPPYLAPTTIEAPCLSSIARKHSLAAKRLSEIISGSRQQQT